MVALTADDLTGTSARVRAKQARRLLGTLVRGRDAGRRRPRLPRLPRGTDPVFVGRTTTVQISVHPPGRDRTVTAAAAQGARQAGPRLRARQRRAAVRAELQRRADQPAAGAGRTPCRCRRPSRPPGSHPTSSAARSGAPTRRCDAGTRCTTTEFAPPSSTTPRAATTTHPRTRRASSGRSTSTTPARWAGATSPTTRSSTSTDRSSRAAQAASTDRSRVRTPAASTATPGAWRCSATSTTCRRPRSSCAPSARLLGWRLGLDHVDPRGTVVLTSAGGSFTQVPRRRDAHAADDLHPPRRRQHRLPGQRRLRGHGRFRDIAARFNDPPGPRTWPTRCAAARSSHKWAADRRR